MGGQSGRMGVDDSNGVSGRWIKSSEGVVGVRRGVALLVSVGGVGWFMVVVVVREEWKR